MRSMPSLSRLRGRVGVGVAPRVAPPVWREVPPPVALARADLPRIRLRQKAGFGGQERER